MVSVDSTRLLQGLLQANRIVFKDNYPLVFIVQPDGRLTFCSEGYRIGTAELIFKSLE